MMHLKRFFQASVCAFFLAIVVQSVMCSMCDSPDVSKQVTPEACQVIDALRLNCQKCNSESFNKNDYEDILVNVRSLLLHIVKNKVENHEEMGYQFQSCYLVDLLQELMNGLLTQEQRALLQKSILMKKEDVHNHYLLSSFGSFNTRVIAFMSRLSCGLTCYEG